MIRIARPLAAAAALAFATTAQAAVVFSAPANLVTDHDPGNPVNLGNVFTPLADSLATSLGFFTPTKLVGGGETVGLYNSSGTLLASTFVAVPLNVAGQYFYQAIAPVLLTAGQQNTVVNFVGQNAWAYGSVTASGAVFNGNSYQYGPTLAFTTNTGGSGPAYFGGNLNIEAVPEPATWAMMLLGFGVIGFGMRRRQSTRTRVTYA